jgi:radical SAM family uncharacterized protein
MQKFLEFKMLEKLLKGIEKPGRYVNHEAGIKSKSLEYILANPDTVLTALFFPDIYEIGMSNAGIGILYDIVNKSPDFSAERVFSPWVDFEESLRKNKTLLFSLENRIFLNNFDLVGFNAAHEMLYTNILNGLQLSGIDHIAERRESIFPLVCAGGTSVFNPWPLSKFMDFMVIGDGEEAIIQILKIIKDFKEDEYISEKIVIEKKPDNAGYGNNGTAHSVDTAGKNNYKIGENTRYAESKEHAGSQKKQLLKKLAAVEGVFIPQFFKIIYNSNAQILDIKSSINGKTAVKKAVLKDLDSFKIVCDPVIPNIRVIHDRFAVEIMRGCSRGCRFCQAGFIYRPVRQRNPRELICSSIEGLKNTGYDEISFTSLSSSDYNGIFDLIYGVASSKYLKRLSVSMPSMRLDNFNVQLAEIIQSGRKTGLTFAPEAGSQRMRDIIKKDITQEDLLGSIKIAFTKGWDRIKLYFMIGLPFETDEDINGIIDLLYKVTDLARGTLPKRSFSRFTLSVSINAFCPKPFTPFQWCPQDDISILTKKFYFIEKNIPKRRVKLHWNSPEKSKIECAMARGDLRTADAVEQAWKNGAKFDNWTDFFNFELWKKSFDQVGVDMDFYTIRRYSQAEILPWDIVDIGVKKEWFLKEYRKSESVLVKKRQVPQDLNTGEI